MMMSEVVKSPLAIGTSGIELACWTTDGSRELRHSRHGRDLDDTGSCTWRVE